MLGEGTEWSAVEDVVRLLTYSCLAGNGEVVIGTIVAIMPGTHDNYHEINSPVPC